MGTSKAQGYTSACEAAKQVLGATKWAAVVQALPPEERALAEKPPLPMAKLASRQVQVLLSTIGRVGFDGDSSRMWEIGAQQMRNDLGGVYRVLIKVASLDAIIKKAASIYGTYTDNGQMMAERVGEKKTRVTLVGVEDADPSYWSYQRGCILGVLEAAGHKVSVEITAGGGNATQGEFEVLELK